MAPLIKRKSQTSFGGLLKTIKKRRTSPLRKLMLKNINKKYISLKVGDYVQKKLFPHLELVGNRMRKSKAVNGQLWQTPKVAIEDLLDQLPFDDDVPENGLVYDPCCGAGSILQNLRLLRPSKFRVTGTDLAVYGKEADILKLNVEDIRCVDVIITNPPYTRELAYPILKWLFEVWEKSHRSCSIYLLITVQMYVEYFVGNPDFPEATDTYTPRNEEGRTIRYHFIPLGQRETSSPTVTTMWVYFEKEDMIVLN